MADSATTKRISGLSRTFEEYKSSLLSFARQYYGQILVGGLGDASVGSFLLDIVASVGDNLSGYIDRAYNETSIDYAQTRRSLLSIARTKGLRIPGQKAALVEVAISADVPMLNGDLDYRYLPIVRKGCQCMGGGTTFETLYDSNFNEQFDRNGISNRTIIPKRDANGVLIGYTVTKREIMSASTTKIFKTVVSDNMAVPFMEIVLSETNVLAVDSIIMKEGVDYSYTPYMGDFAIEDEYIDGTLTVDGKPTWRYWEVDSLLEDKLFLADMTPIAGTYPKLRIVTETFNNNIKNGVIQSITIINGGSGITTTPTITITGGGGSGATATAVIKNGSVVSVQIVNGGSGYDPYNPPTVSCSNAYVSLSVGERYVTSVVKGMWKPITQKFITEYTDKGFLKVIFGAGSDYDIPENPTPAQKLMTNIVNNTNMGILPRPGCTLWIMYHVGGGAVANVSPGSLSGFTYKDFLIEGNGNPNDGDNAFKRNQVYNSIKITNTSAAMGGKSAPTNDEIRYMIKYNNLSQNRCVTLKDYLLKIDQMPGIYGVPFRTAAIEKNNIINIYCISIDNEGHLTGSLSSTMMNNIATYLSEYKMITDYVLIKAASVVNLQVEADVIINKSYNNNDVVKNIIDTVYNFFDVNNRKLGENIYTSQLFKQLLDINGVTNLIDLRIYNIFSSGYSASRTSQSIVTGEYDESGNWQPVMDSLSRVQINLSDTDNVLYSDVDSMYEIKNKNNDIMIRVKNL
jgi:hypothetical protein